MLKKNLSNFNAYMFRKIITIIEKFKSELVDYEKLDKIQELFEKQLYDIRK